MRDKLILTDVDGVLLHWEWQFDMWMKRHGYVKKHASAYEVSEEYGLSQEEGSRLCTMFNETVYVRNIPPLKDAVHYATKLHREHGYVFHAITSMSDDPHVIASRVENLHSVFGKQLFYDITCLSPSVSKLKTLIQYEGSGCYWVEDVTKNYDIGVALGLDCLLMDRAYNQTGPYNRVHNWEDVYNVVIGA